jgi:hypothetical protein
MSSVRECVRCAAETKNGDRCKRNTCIYSEFCHLHTKILFDLTLKKSKIPGAGKGLYTTVNIPKNKNISQYTGEIKSIEDFNADPSGYAVQIPKNKVVDAVSTQSAIARYANDCRTSNRKAKQCTGTNSKFVVTTRQGITKIWLRATKNIPANSEIYISYGKQYWKKK